MSPRLPATPVALLLLTLAACAESASEPTAVLTPLAAVTPERRATLREPERVYPGRVLARIAPGARAGDVAPGYGLAVERMGYANAFVILRGAATGTERAVAARLAGDPRVVWAEPDYLRQPTAIAPELWAFRNDGTRRILYTRGGSKGQVVTSLIPLADADEDSEEGYGANGGAVTIGSVDTGVDFTHPELSGRLTVGYDYYSNDADPSDEDGHGTHTTGTMVGATVGVAGVAGARTNVNVLVYRVCGAMGCPTSAIVSAILAAADAGVVAMNLSLGGSSESQAEKDAIAYAAGRNALVIASAGNGGTSTVSCPACDPLAISVGATDWQDGPSYYTNWGSGLDITAPGGEMYSNTTEEGGIWSAWPGGGYRYLQGTSMAAPQVTGTAGVVASKNATLRGSALRVRLLTTADDKGASGYDTNYGCGRLNSYRAVTGSNFDGSNTVVAGSPCNSDPTTPPALTASFTYSCSSATCNFNGGSSTGATTWNWTFGDGGSASGVTASRTYSAAGSYTVALTIGDGSSTASTSKTVSCTVRQGRLRCS